MSSLEIQILFLVFFILEIFINAALVILNIHEVTSHRNSVPKDFSKHIDKETYNKSVQYTLDKSRFSLFSDVFNSLVLVTLIFSGFFGMVDRFVQELSLPPIPEGVLYVAVIAFVFYCLGLPFNIYSQFRLEKKYGFNKITPSLFVKDQIKSLILSAVLLLLVLSALFYLMEHTGNSWWVIAAITLVLFQLLLTVLYPLFIAPLFNKFVPLEDGELKSELEQLAADNNFRTKGIFVMDGSRRSSHSNAYFTGFGKSKRIVLFDTLLSIVTPKQLTAILAHEIGHEKKHHLLKGFLLSAFITAVMLFIVNILINYLPLYIAFGFNRVSYQGILVILSFCSGPFTFFLTPLFTMWSRKHEYEADAYAVRVTGNKKSLKEGLIALTKENLSNLTPHPLYSFFHYSHPTPGERIRAIEDLA